MFIAMPAPDKDRKSPNIVYVGDIVEGRRVQAVELKLVDEDTNERREVLVLENGDRRYLAPAAGF